MLKQALFFALLAFVLYELLQYRIWLDLDRVVHNSSPGKCKTLFKGGGSEDMAELDEDIILVSSLQNVSAIGLPGKIFALYTNGTIEEARVINTVSEDNPLVTVHGISIWKDPQTGISYLYVIIHGPDKEGVAVFEVTKHPVTLKYIKTITDDAFTGFMNDLAVVDRDKFYITRSYLLRNILLSRAEEGLYLPTGQVVYYNGSVGKVLMSGLRVANGISASNDKRTLCMAEFGAKKIHSLSIKKDGSVDTNWVVDIGSGPDNLHIDSVTGDIWVGANPYMVTSIDIFGKTGYTAGAKILRLRLRDNKISDIEEVYSNNGSEVKAASIAIYKQNKLFIGTPLNQLVMCDVHYLNK